MATTSTKKPVAKTKPLMKAVYSDLVAVNFQIDEKILRPLVPRGLELDFYHGETIADSNSTSAFRTEGIINTTLRDCMGTVVLEYMITEGSSFGPGTEIYGIASGTKARCLEDSEEYRIPIRTNTTTDIKGVIEDVKQFDDIHGS